MINFGLIGLKFGANYINNFNNSLLIKNRAQITGLSSKSLESYTNLKNKPNNIHYHTLDYNELINDPNIHNIIVAADPYLNKSIIFFLDSSECLNFLLFSLIFCFVSDVTIP